MSAFSYDRIKIDNREIPASFHDAILKLKDATAKSWISLDVDGQYSSTKGTMRIYCAIGYLLTVPWRRQLVDSANHVEELPRVLEIDPAALEIQMGMTIADAVGVQNKFDDISRGYLTVAHAKYVRKEAVHEAHKKYRKQWNDYLDSLLELDNYSLE
jgi:hypothetical protein